MCYFLISLAKITYLAERSGIMEWNLYDVLEQLQKRPGMFLGSNVSFASLDSFISGFMLAARDEQLVKPGLPPLKYFDLWLLGYFEEPRIERLSVNGFWHIRQRNPDDQKALEELFRLLEVFKQSKVRVTRLKIDDIVSIRKTLIAHSTTTWLAHLDVHGNLLREPWYWNETEAEESLLREFGPRNSPWTTIT